MTGAGGGDETGGDVAMPVSTKGVMTPPTFGSNTFHNVFV